MRSRFSIAGHPIHPALVPIPIGLAVWSFISAFVCLVNDRSDFWFDMARWTGWATVVSALIAALPGFGDFFTVAAKTNARDVALAHMALNLTVVALYAVASAILLADGARDDGRLGLAVIIEAVALGALMLSGWLGGELSYRYHLGVIPDDARMESDERTHHRGVGRRAGR